MFVYVCISLSMASICTYETFIFHLVIGFGTSPFVRQYVWSSEFVSLNFLDHQSSWSVWPRSIGHPDAALLFMICTALLINAITYISLLPKSCKFWELTVQLPHPLPSHISVYITSCCAANDLLPTFTCVNVNSTSHTSICANMLETKMGYLVQSCSIVCLQFQAENVQHTWRRQKEAQHWQLKSSY